MVSTLGFEPRTLPSSGECSTGLSYEDTYKIREEYIEALSSCVFPIVYLLAEFEPLTTRNKLLK